MVRRHLALLLLAVASATCRGTDPAAPPSAGAGDTVGGTAVMARRLGPGPTAQPDTVAPSPVAAELIATTPSATPVDLAALLAQAYPRPKVPTPELTPTAERGTPALRAPTATRSPRGAGTGSSSPGGDRGGSGGRAGPSRTPKPSSTPRAKAPTRTPVPTEDRSLLTALRQGGYVVYLRHAQTDWDQNERELAWVPEMLEDRSLLADCDRQRLLTDDGRDQSRTIGQRIRGQGIPVGRVLASPWCRTRETAELAFGGAEVAADQLFDTGYLASGSDERRHFREALRALLAETPGGGTNTVIVGHMPQLADAAGLQLNEGEAAIFEPRGDRHRLVRRVPPEGWENLGNR